MAITAKDLQDSIRQDGLDPETMQPLQGQNIPIQQNEISSQSQMQQPSSMEQLHNLSGIVAKPLLGAAEAAVDPFFRAGTAINRGINRLTGANIPDVPITGKTFGQQLGIAEDPSYKYGQIPGTLAGYMAGGEVLGAGLKGAEALSGIGQAAKALSSSPAMTRILGNVGYGAVEDPEQPSGGALKGLIGGSIAEVPGISSQLVKPFTAKQIAADIKKAYGVAKHGAKEIYQPVFDEIGKKNIYNTSFGYLPKNFKNLDNEVFDTLNNDPDLRKYTKDFLDTPTFDNAHKLQSVIGTEMGSIKNPNLADAIQIKNMKLARDTLQRDMQSFLQKQDPTQGLSTQYKQAIDQYKQNVVPYLSDKRLRAIAEGKITNPKNLDTIFKSPEPTLEKVMKDIGEWKIKGRQAAPAVAGTIGGAALGHVLGIPAATEIGAYGGFKYGPGLLKKLTEMIPEGTKIPTDAGLKSLLLSNLLKGSQ